MRVKYKILSLVMLLSLAMTAYAAPSRTILRAKLDSTVLLMGRMTHLEVSLEQEKGAKGFFPLFREIKENGIIPVCGDSVELRAPVKVDTVEDGNMWKISMKVPVQSFDSGYYRLPELIYVSGKDTTRSGAVALKVVPVMNVTAETPIDDYANVADPENSSIFDSLPNWLYNYWWIILLALLLAAAAWYFYRRYRKEGTILRKKPQPTPYEVAIASLRDLKEKKLWEQGMEKEYFTDLIDILRTYLYGRFGINAMEMTSRQIMAALANNEDCRDKRPYVRQILTMADFVKFAKVRPLPDDNVAAYDNALKFVEETKPVPVEEPEEEAEAPNGKKKKKASKKGGKS